MIKIDIKEKWMIGMFVTDHYDSTAVQVDGTIQISQKIIVIPIESKDGSMDMAASGLHKYVNPSIIRLEKNAWREAMVKRHDQK